MVINNVKYKKTEILKQFVEVCETNSLWYSLDEKTLLLAFTKNNFDDFMDHYEVFMTYDSYEKLKLICPKNVLDNSKHSRYFDLQCKFISDINNIYENQPFLNINLILPTTIKKLRKFVSYKNKKKSQINHYLSYRNTNVSSIKNKIVLSKLLRPFYLTFSYKELINSLYTDEYEGFIITQNIITKNIIDKWIGNLSFRTKNVILNSLTVKVIEEYEDYLINLFGKNYAEFIPNEPANWYINPIEKYNFAKIDLEENKPTSEIKVFNTGEENKIDGTLKTEEIKVFD
ncbi:hypothetical protein PR254_01210 [Metamycoplasma hyosynoviae]|uniref:hypothetical protein n=1 Tax=Metamycoplasma hyosynoviae TaxID=29559 RepID=UPI0023593C07|nr:hypothetical protein [Metamycoplasma hyosynoviae]MDC8927069.1 hypothetical protein [Metamycoplasma hyosynoviae]